MKKKLQRMIGTAEIMMYGLMCKSFTVFADEAGTASSTSGMVESLPFGSLLSDQHGDYSYIWSSELHWYTVHFQSSVS